MITKNFDVKAKDGLALSAKIWQADGDAKGIICLIHGFGEHQDRYVHVTQLFAQNQLTTYSFDLRGHGNTVGKRGHFKNYDLLLDDIDSMIAKIKTKHPNLPIIIYGHSMGGNIVANYILIRSTSSLKGALLTSPWFVLTTQPADGKIKMARIMNKIFPSFAEEGNLDTDDLSHDKAVGAAYIADPLVQGKISVRAFTSIYDAGLWALDNANKLSLPTLLVHGTSDKITSFEASIDFSKNAGEQCELKLWDGLRHETHNELEKEKVLDYNLQWILKVINN